MTNLFFNKEKLIFREYARFPVSFNLDFDFDVFYQKHHPQILVPKELENNNFYCKFTGNREKTAIILERFEPGDLHDYYNFVSAHKYQHSNAQGLLIAWEQGQQYFPDDCFVDGLDHQENLFKDCGNLIRVLRIKCNQGETLLVMGFLRMFGRYTLIYE